MSRVGWIAGVFCSSILLISGPAWAKAKPTVARTGMRAGQNISPEKVFAHKPFTADMVVKAGKKKDQTFEGKMYAGTHALRMDMRVRPGMESTTIVRYDKKVVWVLIPGQHRYMEMPISPRAGMMAALRDTDAKVELQSLGAEKVGEYECEKYRVQSTSQGHEYNGLVWIASSGSVKGLIVRAEDEKSGATTEYRNIQPGEPDASLFEVPAGYQKFKMPAMGGMSGIPHR